MNLLKHLDRFFLILMHLYNQFVYRIKLDFWTEEANELDAHLLVVDVAFEVKDMHFDAEVCAVIDSRTMADVQHTFVLLAIHRYIYGIDSDGRNQLVGEIHSEVSGREAYLSTDLIATYDGSFEEVVVTQVFLGVHNIAGEQRTTDGR